MKKFITGWLAVVFLIPILPGGPSLEACTTFLLKRGNGLVFGRNYDWNIGVGMVIVNKRNLAKKAFNSTDPALNPVRWVSKYGSITFNQYGKEYPSGGMNEAGLVVEVMWLQDTRYPSPDGRASLDELQWVQYQLDTSASVKEVKESDSAIRIVTDGVPVHFLVSDKAGNAAAIEFLDGKMVDHTGETMPVTALTNSTYDESKSYLRKHKGFGGPLDIPTSEESLDRFVRAADGLRAYDKAGKNGLVPYAFSILESVRQMFSTQWRIVYDVTNLTVHFKTRSAPLLKTFAFRDFDFSCETPSRVIDMNTHQSGDLGGYFMDYRTELNRRLIGESFKGTKFLKDTPDKDLDEFANYPESITCQKSGRK